MAYPAPVFEQEPDELRGRYYAGAQIINTSFAEGAVGKMRAQIGICQRAKLRVIRDNETDLRADFQANIAAARTRAGTIRDHIAQEVTELSNAGIWYMPTLGFWMFGIDTDDSVGGVIASMPGGYPMTGAVSLYNSLGNGAGAWSGSQNNKHTVRAFLWQLAVFADGGTYAGSAGAKPGPNRTTALGGDPLIDAIWAAGVAEIISFLTDIGYGQAGKKIWLQWMNGPENSESLTLENFWDTGYFSNSTSDLKQAAGNAIATLCNTVAPTTATEGSAAARDTLYHQRMTWAVQRIMAEIEAAFPAAANDVILYQSMHEYDRKNRERFAGKFDSEIIDEFNFDRPYNEARTGHVDRDSNYLDDDYDQDRVFYLRVKAGVSAVLSVDGGRTTVTVAADASSATLRTALRTLPGFGDGDEAVGGFDDVTIEYHQGPASDSGDFTVRDIGTQYEIAGGYATRGYHIRMGAISGASNSKSKLKESGVILTSHNATPTDCKIFSWIPGGSADRGAALKNWVKRKVSLGVRGFIYHNPIDSRTYNDAIWVYGPVSQASPQSYENWRVATGRSRQGHVGGPMFEDEPYHHFWFWNEFGKYLDSLNP